MAVTRCLPMTLINVSFVGGACGYAGSDWEVMSLDLLTVALSGGSPPLLTNRSVGKDVRNAENA